MSATLNALESSLETGKPLDLDKSRVSKVWDITQGIHIARSDRRSLKLKDLYQKNQISFLKIL